MLRFVTDIFSAAVCWFGLFNISCKTDESSMQFT